MQQSDLQKEEKAELAKLDPVELAARQAELRRQRDLMYRAERKAKRVSKIKSKAFRRIHRKKGKDGQGPELSLEDMAELDAIDGGNRVDEERNRLEILRAKERATLKHSNKGGRWAQKLDGLEGLEEERNASIRDMVARRDELRKRIAGIESGDEVDEFASSGSDRSDDEEGEGGGDFDSIRRRAFDELASLDAKEAAAKEADPKAKGVMQMKFMKDAMARADRDVQREADELRNRLAQMDEMAEREDDEEDQPMVLSEQVQGNLGRMVFGPAGGVGKVRCPSPLSRPLSQHTDGPLLQPSAPQPEASADVVPSTSTVTKLSSVSIPSASPSTSSRRTRPSLSNPGPTASTSTAEDGESNPWLALADSAPSAGKVSRKANKASFGRDETDAAKTATKVARTKAKSSEARQAEQDDAKVEIDLSEEASLKVAEKAKKGKGATAGSKGVGGGALAARPAERMGANREEDEDDDGYGDELDEDEINAQRGKGPAAFRQRELVKEAFANDDVVAVRFFLSSSFPFSCTNSSFPVTGL
jgi:U3 small nucleolar RNA-associated protein 14